MKKRKRKRKITIKLELVWQISMNEIVCIHFNIMETAAEVTPAQVRKSFPKQGLGRIPATVSWFLLQVSKIKLSHSRDMDQTHKYNINQCEHRKVHLKKGLIMM